MFKVKSSLSDKEEYLTLTDLKFKYGTIIVGDLFEDPFTEHVIRIGDDTISIVKER